MKTKLLITQKALLIASGGLLILIGAFITLSPAEFYASNGITVGANVNLLNELKAPAGFLLIAGLFIVGAIFSSHLTYPALGLATLVYLSYAAARLLSVLIDGIPVEGLLAAGILEAVIGVLCLAMLTIAYRARSTD